MTEFTIKFLNQNKSTRVSRGTDLLNAAARCGIAINASCGGEGLCGKCRVIVKKGVVKAEPSRLIDEGSKKKGMVLACQALVESDLEVDIPKETLGLHERISHESEEFTKGIILKREGTYKRSPLVKKIYLELNKPTEDDNISDLERICLALGEHIDDVMISTKLASVKHIGEILRENDFKVTVTVSYKDGGAEILLVEGGDTSRYNYGFAFDIGTTTIVGQLVDLNKGGILGTRIVFNMQAAYGSDVITRIIYASNPEGLETLNRAVFENIDEMIDELARSNKVSLGDLNALVCAGNMTMMHLLLKIDPTNIRKAPYVPATTVFPPVWASELGFDTNPKAIVSFLPGVSTYIGGDIVAGILACGLADTDEISLLADIGTNGEIVLGNREWMIGAAASAGPAFEGSGLAFGMKAVNGAIDKVNINEKFEVDFSTIGGGKARGICGSGYIDLLCQMLKRGIMGRDGRINREAGTDRVRKGESNYEFVVAYAGETDISRDIVIQEDDIENIKRAKAAMYSAIVALLRKVEKKMEDVKRVYIGGGFGNYLNIENAIFIGLLPDTARSVYEFVGNSSLAGARMSLLSREAYRRAFEISKNITYLDLSSEPEYMDEYIAALFFPHTDSGRFPSVRL